MAAHKAMAAVLLTKGVLATIGARTSQRDLVRESVRACTLLTVLCPKSLPRTEGRVK